MNTPQDIIRNLREERGWSHADVARLSGVSDRMARRAELATVPRTVLEALADAFGVHYDDLFPESPFPDCSNEIGAIRMEILRWCEDDQLELWTRWKLDGSTRGGQLTLDAMDWLESEGLIEVKPSESEPGERLVAITVAGFEFLDEQGEVRP